MQPGEHGSVHAVRRIEDVSSGQYLDLGADAPTFDIPGWMAPDSLLAFLDAAHGRLFFFRADGIEDWVDQPEVKRLHQRRQGERCLVTTGRTDEQGRRVFWICRVER